MSGGSFRTTFGAIGNDVQVCYRKHYPRGTRYRFQNKYDPAYGSRQDQLVEVDYKDLIMYKIAKGKAIVQTVGEVSVEGNLMVPYCPYMMGRKEKIISVPDDLPIDVFTPGD